MSDNIKEMSESTGIPVYQIKLSLGLDLTRKEAIEACKKLPKESGFRKIASLRLDFLSTTMDEAIEAYSIVGRDDLISIVGSLRYMAERKLDALSDSSEVKSLYEKVTEIKDTGLVETYDRILEKWEKISQKEIREAPDTVTEILNFYANTPPITDSKAKSMAIKKLAKIYKVVFYDV